MRNKPDQLKIIEIVEEGGSLLNLTASSNKKHEADYKRADLVVDIALAEDILEAVGDPAAYAYFNGRIKSIRGE